MNRSQPRLTISSAAQVLYAMFRSIDVLSHLFSDLSQSVYLGRSFRSRNDLYNRPIKEQGREPVENLHLVVKETVC
jgi:hypothetical protein